MAIRIRLIKGEAVALCAAKTGAKNGDIYLDDNVHHALTTKFVLDFQSEGVNIGGFDPIIKRLMREAEK